MARECTACVNLNDDDVRGKDRVTGEWLRDQLRCVRRAVDRLRARARPRPVAVFAAGDTAEGARWAREILGDGASPDGGALFVTLPGASVHSTQAGGAARRPGDGPSPASVKVAADLFALSLGDAVFGLGSSSFGSNGLVSAFAALTMLGACRRVKDADLEEVVRRAAEDDGHRRHGVSDDDDGGGGGDDDRSLAPLHPSIASCAPVYEGKNCDQMQAADPEHTCAYVENLGYSCVGCTCPIPTPPPTRPLPPSSSATPSVSPSLFPSLHPTEKWGPDARFLSFGTQGLVNNYRIGLQHALALALLLNRTLVLPPAKCFISFPNGTCPEHTLSFYFDLDDAIKQHQHKWGRSVRVVESAAVPHEPPDVTLRPAARNDGRGTEEDRTGTLLVCTPACRAACPHTHVAAAWLAHARHVRIAPAFHFYFTAVSSDAAVQARLDAVAHFPVPYRKAIVAEAERIAKVLRGWFGNYSCAHLRAVPGTPTGDLWIEDHTSTDDTSTDEVDRTPVQFAARVARAGVARGEALYVATSEWPVVILQSNFLD